ncbi:hypothetical protein MLD38_011940 [Melastoma candidum]|uniref:Uncharacterized protein n=1 Tax=Melastoma candidum TaxID=119954 RepID=A0ACB9R439_9MYRT|nr:hypothetical protein MLD38_011940 [Melastoma candidum]
METCRLSGTSGLCETFGNSCLAHSMDFELKNVEKLESYSSALQRGFLMMHRQRDSRQDTVTSRDHSALAK